jgi:SSS family solute:Na+ symporter
MVTGTIYLASISAMLIACCYWRRANSWGAAASIIFGALIPIACLVTEQLKVIPANQIQLWRSYTGIAAFLAAGIAMVIGSLLKPTTASSESDESPGIAGGVP